jgi:hypothetical protein
MAQVPAVTECVDHHLAQQAASSHTFNGRFNSTCTKAPNTLQAHPLFLHRPIDQSKVRNMNKQFDSSAMPPGAQPPEDMHAALEHPP